MMATRPEEIMGPLEKGRRRYQKQDFAGALKAFTEAIEISTDHLLLNALDNRAATYEKLGQLQSALRDAKQMIDMKPKLSKGYLRCGKVLRLKGEPVVALKIYDRGLRKVKIGADDDRVKLQMAYNQLKAAQSPGKTRDPLERFPPELALMVMRNVTVKDLVVCLAVSKGWKGWLEEREGRELWRTFDTSNVKRIVALKSLKIYLRRSNWMLEKAIISARSGIEGQKLTILTRNCANLREIQFVGNGFIGDTLVTALPYAKNIETLVVGSNMNMTLSTLYTVLEKCHHHLVNISFLNVKGSRLQTITNRWVQMNSLRTINLRSDRESILDITGLCRATPNSTSVILNDWKFPLQRPDLSAWTRLQHLDMSGTATQDWPILPPTLTHLLISNNPMSQSTPDANIPTLPLLETFACDRTVLSPATIKSVLSQSITARTLKRLSLPDTAVADDGPNAPFPEAEIPASSTVEELSLRNVDISEQRLLQIANRFPSLRKLNASGTRITGVAVRQLVDSGVMSLTLNDCQHLAADAVQWARSQGAEVEFFHWLPDGAFRATRYLDTPFARGF